MYESDSVSTVSFLHIVLFYLWMCLKTNHIEQWNHSINYLFCISFTWDGDATDTGFVPIGCGLWKSLFLYIKLNISQLCCASEHQRSLSVMSPINHQLSIEMNNNYCKPFKSYVQKHICVNVPEILTLEPPGVTVYLKPPMGKFYPRTWQQFLYG